MNKPDIEKIEIDLFLEALNRRYGYDFRNYAQASVRRRVQHLLAKTEYTQISELIPRILYDEAYSQSLVHAFSITVTEMFRDPSFYRSIREKVIPYLRTYPFVRVWHAGCATGEEVYSMAILLQEEGLYERTTLPLISTMWLWIMLEKGSIASEVCANMPRTIGKQAALDLLPSIIMLGTNRRS